MARKREGAILCPSCNKLIDVGERRCPYCGTMLPGLWGFGPGLLKIFGERIDIVTAIPIACIILYALSLALDIRSALGSSGGLLGILAPSGRALLTLGMTSHAVVFGAGHWWTLLTSIYLHGNLLHIFFNLMWIRQLGPNVATAYGPARFFVIFTVSGAAGFFLSDLLSGAWTIGASGSVFGLLAALIVFGRRIGGSMGQVLSRQVLQWAVILFLFGFFMPGVNNLAHLGGFIGGWVSSTLTARPLARQQERGPVLVALVLLAATAFAFLMALLRAGKLMIS